VHLLFDSTGLRLGGPGEWLVEKHGTQRRRSWRKLHIGVDAETGQIPASELTTSDVDDGSQVRALLDQITDPLASFTGDGAYDEAGIDGTVAQRHPAAQTIAGYKVMAMIRKGQVVSVPANDIRTQSAFVVGLFSAAAKSEPPEPLSGLRSSYIRICKDPVKRRSIRTGVPYSDLCRILIHWSISCIVGLQLIHQ
jgi:PAS domain-containing protein